MSAVIIENPDQLYKLSSIRCKIQKSGKLEKFYTIFEHLGPQADTVFLDCLF